MNAVAPALSAWTLSSAPALVQCLEQAFLSGLKAGLQNTPYLSGETREGIANLLKREAPVRQIGDALMISYASEWAKRQARELGENNVRCSFHGAERLFEPLGSPPAPPAIPDFETKKARFLEDFTHLDLMSRAILEVRLPSEAVFRRSQLLAAHFYYLDDQIGPLGFHPCTRVDVEGADPDGESVLRFFSLTALELGLYVFLGSSSPRFCLGPGVSLPGKVNGLHKSAYHLVGIPTHGRKVHGGLMPPLPFLWHDIGHGAHWALRESASERLAATLLYESAQRTMNGERKLNPVALQIDRLLDLELALNGGVFGILGGLKNVLLPDRFGALVRDFSRRMDSIEDVQTQSYSRELRQRIASLA